VLFCRGRGNGKKRKWVLMGGAKKGWGNILMTGGEKNHHIEQKVGRGDTRRKALSGLHLAGGQKLRGGRGSKAGGLGDRSSEKSESHEVATALREKRFF